MTPDARQILSVPISVRKCFPHFQGHSVFQGNTNEAQGEVRLSREAAARGRYVGVPCRSPQSNSGAAGEHRVQTWFRP